MRCGNVVTVVLECEETERGPNFGLLAIALIQSGGSFSILVQRSGN